MLSRAFHRYTEEHRIIELVLVFALVFAVAHVALHDLDVSGDGLEGHGECQVCRFNHVPVASLAVPFLLAPVQLFVHVLLVADAEYQLSHPFHIQWARAPPLF